MGPKGEEGRGDPEGRPAARARPPAAERGDVKFEEFVRRYRDELEQPPTSEAVARLRARAGRQRIVLVTATRDVEHSGAWVLATVVSEKT
jgi:uncharacterized protein YeaO (DUF488 family)